MNILFIGPIFFDYEKAIKAELANRFKKVIFRCEIPFNSPYKYYALKRLFPKLTPKILKRYNQSLVDLAIKENIDTIFIIRGFGLTSVFFDAIKIANPKIKIIHYQWDSVQNNPNALMISSYADANFSFDLADTIKHPIFVHVPLFYTWGTLNTKYPHPDRITKDIDLLFIGAYHSERHKIIELAKQECRQQGLIVFSHIYYPFGSYIRNRLTSKTISRKDISCKKVCRADYYNLLCRSKVVLDIQNITQTGATMRTIESLSMHLKIVSTNGMLRNEKFYSDKNIKIWDLQSALNLKEVINTEFDVSKNEYVMDLNQWLTKLGLYND